MRFIKAKGYILLTVRDWINTAMVITFRGMMILFFVASGVPMDSMGGIVGLGC